MKARPCCELALFSFGSKELVGGLLATTFLDVEGDKSRCCAFLSDGRDGSRRRGISPDETRFWTLSKPCKETVVTIEVIRLSHGWENKSLEVHLGSDGLNAMLCVDHQLFDKVFHRKALPHTIAKGFRDGLESIEINTLALNMNNDANLSQFDTCLDSKLESLDDRQALDMVLRKLLSEYLLLDDMPRTNFGGFQWMVGEGLNVFDKLPYRGYVNSAGFNSAQGSGLLAFGLEDTAMKPVKGKELSNGIGTVEEQSIVGCDYSSVVIASEGAVLDLDNTAGEVRFVLVERPERDQVQAKLVRFMPNLVLRTCIMRIRSVARGDKATELGAEQLLAGDFTKEIALVFVLIAANSCNYWGSCVEYALVTNGIYVWHCGGLIKNVRYAQFVINAYLLNIIARPLAGRCGFGTVLFVQVNVQEFDGMLDQTSVRRGLEWRFIAFGLVTLRLEEPGVVDYVFRPVVEGQLQLRRGSVRWMSEYDSAQQWGEALFRMRIAGSGDDACHDVLEMESLIEDPFWVNLVHWVIQSNVRMNNRRGFSLGNQTVQCGLLEAPD